jgi:YYY domain-containing protein
MMAFVTWYLAIVLIGWLAFPLSFRLLRFLPDKGVVFGKPLGLLLSGFIFWILVSFHAIQNDAGGVLFGLVVLAGLSYAAGRGQFGAMRAWLRSNRNVIVTAELLFLLAFSALAILRAAVPEASGTEKPMELAFINAIMRSPSFPPHDPWLSGYAISYYYFGYVLVAMLAKVSGIAGSVAFNLGLASWFGMAALAAYGLLYNLLELRPEKIRRVSFVMALIAPIFVLLVSNLGGALEVLHAADIFWQPAEAAQSVPVPAAFPPKANCLIRAGSQQQSVFWSWLDVQELNCPPVPPYSFVPSRPGGIWWWRSSRVLTDYDLNNAPREVIDEFPTFSYLLGDLHPHVLSMPFVLLAVALALNMFLLTLNKGNQAHGWREWLREPEFWLGAVVLGGLSFLNTWDFPIYLALFSAAYVFARAKSAGLRWSLILEFLLLMVELGVAGLLLYLPFYIGFASQAGGVIPSLSFFTRGAHFWVMFGTLLIPLVFWLLASQLQAQGQQKLALGLGVSAGLVFGLWLLSYLFAGVMLLIPERSSLLVGLQGNVEPALLLLQSLARRIAMPGAWLSLLGILTLVVSQLLYIVQKRAETVSEEVFTPDSDLAQPTDVSRAFVLLMVLVGAGLVLFPEFFYLRDQFGWRMNTIFKFYYQAWILWAVAAAYASACLWDELNGLLAWLGRIGAVAAIGLGLIYPVFLIPDRANNFKPQVWSLDGADYLLRYNTDEYNGIQFLQSAPYGVVAEAVGGSYDAGFARIATHTGLPNVLGWPGHESQWRGGGEEIGSRQTDVELLYTTTDWNQAKSVLERYAIRYVYIGGAETSKYRVNLAKFEKRLSIVYTSGSVVIYEVPTILP